MLENNYFSIRLFGHSGSSKKIEIQELELVLAVATPTKLAKVANNFNISTPPLYISKHFCLNHNFYNCCMEV